MRGRSASRNLALLAVGAGGVGWASLGPKPLPAGKLSFSRDIMPILSDMCFKCHGPDSETRMANLRLDTPESVFANRSGHFAIVPGHPDRSVLVRRITGREMPPPGSGKSLSSDEISTLTRWIAQGAPYGKLWSFEPLPAKVPIPVVKSSWPRDAMDRFVLVRLAKHGLAPSPPASGLRWLRRVTYDLTGLPPTEAEIGVFDGSNAACENAVDWLLASPHFGEHLAVDWLDAARYSDSYGYQSDLLSPTWPYRDWVVKAFNDNLPYNRFLVDQLAGDLLPSPTRNERLATAFNRLHRQSNEGGSIPLEFQTEYAADRVATYGAAVLGLTLGCARCHDHKFDPITQREYYQLFAYFNSIKESGLVLSTAIVPTPSMLLPTPEQERRLQELKLANDAALKNLSITIVNSRRRFAQWLYTGPTLLEEFRRFSVDKFGSGKSDRDFPGESIGAKPPKVEAAGRRHGPALQFDGDNGIKFAGFPGRERWDAFTWSFWVDDPRPTSGPVVLEHRTGGTDVGFCGFDLMLENGYLTARVMRHWPGNAIGVRTVRPIAKDRWTHVAWSWDGFGRAAGLKIYIDGRRAETTVLNDRLWKKVSDYGDLGASGGDWTFALRFRDAGFRGKVADVVFADHALCDLEVAQVYDGKSLQDALWTAEPPAPTHAFSDGHKHPAAIGEELFEYYTSAVDRACGEAAEAVQRAQEQLAKYEEGVMEVSVMEEASTEIPAYLLARGNYDAPRTAANRVERGVPACLPPLHLAVIGPPHSGPQDAKRWTFASLGAPSPPVRKLTDPSRGEEGFGLVGGSRAHLSTISSSGEHKPFGFAQGRQVARGGEGRNDRLALAEWSVRGDNPLTARVAVNRLWQMLFGVGLVETSENFGVQGSRPINRELLDYLAREFIDSGWNVKALLRRIVLSATYRQDSALTKDLLAKDPENHLLSRGPSHRLAAEELRDTALAAAGLLNIKLGGPPVNPYQPAGIWRENNTMSPEFVQSKGADLYRRSIYSTWKRTTPVPSMMLFDATSREACAIRRQTTNTPLQALVLLNDVQFVEAARVLAERVLVGRGNDADHLAEAFRRLAGRDPDEREVAILFATLQEQRAVFRADNGGAKRLIRVGDSPPRVAKAPLANDGVERSSDQAHRSGGFVLGRRRKGEPPLPGPIDLAAMTATIQVIMNSDSVVWER